jgi:hypothetical protein
MFRASGYQGVLPCATYFSPKLIVTQILGLVFMEGTMSCDHLPDLHTSWQAHADTFPNMSEAASGLVSHPKAQSYLEKRANSFSIHHLQKSSNFREKRTQLLPILHLCLTTHYITALKQLYSQTKLSILIVSLFCVVQCESLKAQ